MTTEQASQQGKQYRPTRAVWLARLPAGASSGSEAQQQRQRAARNLADEAGVTIVGEFLYSSLRGGGLSGGGWKEVLDLCRRLNAGTLLLLHPDQVSRQLDTFVHHTKQLEEAGICLKSADLQLRPQAAVSDAKRAVA